MHAFSPFWQVIMILPCYIHGIYIFGIIYRPWKWHFWSYILFARSRIQNWRKNGLIWRKIQKKKLNFMDFMVFVFSKSGGDPMLGSDRLSYRCGKDGASVIRIIIQTMFGIFVNCVFLPYAAYCIWCSTLHDTPAWYTAWCTLGIVHKLCHLHYDVYCFIFFILFTASFTLYSTIVIV